MGESSLFLFGAVFSAIPPLVMLLFNVYGFQTNFKHLRPKLSLFQRKYLADITNLGFKFFIIQIAAMVLLSTDNFLISHLFSPEEVVPYNIAFKYFSIVSMLYAILITPFWSSFTDAYAKQDIAWIKAAVKKIQLLWLLVVPALLLVMIFLSDTIYELWVGPGVGVPLSVSLGMALFVLMLTFNQVYVNFINGVGIIKIQLITACITMVINIPISIYLAAFTELGVAGVILGTCVCMGYSVVLRPLQYYKVISGKGKGVWIS